MDKKNVNEMCRITAIAIEVLDFLGEKDLSFMEMRKVLTSADGIVNANINVETMNYSLQKILNCNPED